MTRTDTRILGFDGLRAIAFLLVFVSHKLPTPLTERYGTAGVWIFFVLSGYLITRILARMRSDVETGSATTLRSLMAFYVRRTARIFPVYYAFLGVLTLMAWHGWIFIGEPKRQLSYWLYLSNIYIERNNWATDLGHLWSLAVEEQFYVLFAPLALFCPRRFLPQLCLALVGLSIAAHVTLRGSAMPIVTYDVNSVLNFGLLALGGLAGLASVRPLPSILASEGAVAATALLVLLCPALFTAPGSWLFYGRATGVFTALLLVQIAQRQGSRLVVLLNWAPLRALGIISYAAYLFHPVIKSAELVRFAGLAGGLPHAVSMPVDLALTVVLASCSWLLLEKPARAALISALSRPLSPGKRLNHRA